MISKVGLGTALTGGVFALSLLAGWLLGNYSDAALTTGNWAHCTKSCHSHEDCNLSSSDCNICAYFGKEGKMCTSMTHATKPKLLCGGLLPALPRNPSLPQYLFIGDPIMRPMFTDLKNKLKGIVDAYLAPGNPKTIEDARKCIGTWIGTNPNRWDIVSLHLGAYDASGTGNVSQKSGTFAVNVDNVIGYILNHTGKTKVIYGLITPTPNIGACCSESKTKFNITKGIRLCPCNIDYYNSAARQVLTLNATESRRVFADDLWSWVNLNCCGQQNCTYTSCSIQPNINPHNCPVTFSGKGLNYLALNVSGTVKNILKPH